MKKIICVLLCLSLLGGMLGLGAAAAEPAFRDVSQGADCYEAVMACAENGILIGKAPGEFYPQRALSWVEAVTAAVRAAQYIRGEDIYGAGDQGEPWYEVYMEYAYENGITGDTPDNIKAAITRGEAALIFAGVLVQGYFPPINDLPADYFSDVDESSEYYYAIHALAGAGISCGAEEGLFGPDELISRGEMAIIAARLAGIVPRVEISLPQPEPTPSPSPSHSELYIEGLDVEDVITYFAEVCLDTEYGDKEGGSLIRKWVNPIYYNVYGEPTARDMYVLNSFVNELNGISGFPGMYPVEMAADLSIYFYGEQAFVDLMGSDFAGNWGGVTFWYDGLSQIYSETISIRTDIPQDARDSIIAEELYNGVGPVQDTSLRGDSLICEWSNENYEMTAIDELILKLLYHPSICPGMNYNQCETIIKELYY